MCDGCSCDSYLMRTNVGDKKLRDKGHLLLIGSCLMERFPEIVEEYAKSREEKTILHICLEETHMNMAGFKIASMVSYAGIGAISVLTIEGSPHCVQLHYLAEDIKRHFIQKLKTNHFVIEKGEVLEVSPESVKRSRHLSKI